MERHPVTQLILKVSLKWNERPEAILISTSVICMALWLAGEDSTKTTNKHGFLQFTNLLASLLHTACRIAEQEREKEGWHVVIMFLWSTWQRSVMLYLWCIIKAHLLEGFDPDDTTPRLTLTSLPNYIKSHYYNETNKADYMCNWAYEVLRNDAGSKALDFRRFHQRFNAKFGDKNPRSVHSSCPVELSASSERISQFLILIDALRGQMKRIALFAMERHLCTAVGSLVGGDRASRHTTLKAALANQCSGRQNPTSVCKAQEQCA
jgi:hypothetical protein